MEETKLKELLKEAFNKGRDYQYDINPYSGKLKENSKALTFTKWYNQVKNINVIPCCESDSEQLVCAVDYLPNLTKGKKYTCKPDGLIFFEVKDDFGIAYKIHKRCFKNEVIAN